MSRRVSKAEGAAMAALFVAMITVAVAMVVAMAKALGAIVKWIGATASDLASSDPLRVLRGRARVATVNSALVVLAGYAVVATHAGRSPWHEAHAAWEPLGFAMMIAAGSLVFLTWRSATGLGATVPLKHAAGPLIPAAAVAMVVWTVDGPSLSSAEARLRAGELDDARLTASAVASLDGMSPAVASLLDRIHEREVTSQSDLTRAFSRFRGQWNDPAVRARAAASLHETSAREAGAASARDDAERLDALAVAADALPDEARMFRSRAALARVARRPNGPQDCPATDLLGLRGSVPPAEYDARFATVRDRIAAQYRTQVIAARGQAGDHGDAIRVWSSARNTAHCLAALGTTPVDPTLPEIEVRLAELGERQQRDAAAAERQREREARAAEHSERRRARSGSGGGDVGGGSRCGNRVQCCDGSCSPSCGLNRSSFRGCCSHHGGICG
jgi:hypothetical protein